MAAALTSAAAPGLLPSSQLSLRASRTSTNKVESTLASVEAVASKHRQLQSHSGLRLSSSAKGKVWSTCRPVSKAQKAHTTIVADNARQQWDVGRFVKTLLYFNEPPSMNSLDSKFCYKQLLTSLLERFTGARSGQTNSSMRQTEGEVGKVELVLVTGATGGVGKRVVDILRQNGYAVRALVRNVDKARNLLGPGVDYVAADISQAATLQREYFVGVTRVINCAACIVGPKEGDTADRQKYYQGIKFYDPEASRKLYTMIVHAVYVKGDTPKAVEFLGVQNIVNSIKKHVGLRKGRTLFCIAENGLPIGPAWGPLDDVVMGGVSQSGLQIDPKGGMKGGSVGIFTGRNLFATPVCVVSTDNSGGFASIRTKNFNPLEDLSAYEGLELNVKGDGHRYKLILRTTTDWDAVGYTVSFDTKRGEWQKVRLPFTSFIPVFRAKTVRDAEALNTSQIASIQLMYSKFEYDSRLNPSFTAGRFELPFDSIHAYLPEPVTPRFVHVGSAGATRPERPGLDLSKQPPAVRMNKELGGILTFKLKGEDVVRDSGVPFTIVRPCALTEEPAGAELIFDQGDNLTVKSTVPFSEPFTVDSSNPPPARDYSQDFAKLKTGITGKEALEKVPVAVS
eukprot:SM000142S00556  [mRNA]  locus=s142:222539:227860:- [translate_table: standard]